MTTNSPFPSNKTKDLLNRLIFLEKFIELKSNECAYYRSKVHLMQMSSLSSQTRKTSSNEDISHSSTVSNSLDHKHRTSSVPNSSKKKFSNSSIPFDRSVLKYGKQKKNSAQNQNYYVNDVMNEKILFNKQFLSSDVNQHQQKVLIHNKNIQCNEHELYPREISSQTTLIIRLPRRFIKSLVKQQNKSTIPKLKVHLSSELLHKLLQSTVSKKFSQPIDKFAIQSQFGTIAATINHEDINNQQQNSRVLHAKAEVKIDNNKNRLPVIRHIARTKTDVFDRQKMPSKHRHQRRKKRHLHRLSSTSHDDIFSEKSSETNVTQSIRTFSSSN
ncbi:hypothetical protein I4U23_028982 [Adineta vaga]|nr:hypothetical protein I4U23_028982 [Adineta vaga]